MPVSTADAKKRIVLPGARPGEVYDIQRQSEGRLLVVRLEQSQAMRLSKARCLEAIDAAPLRMRMSWKDLEALTRQP